MPMDGLMLGFVARELGSLLVGGRVDRVTQPERDEINLTIRNHNQNQILLLSANPGTARAHLTDRRKNSPLEPPMFCMLLRKHLIGGRLSAVRQVNADRILELDFENLSELGDPSVKTLVCEFMGKHSNLMLIEQPTGKIVDSARHVTADISRVREVLPGLVYERPPAQDKQRFDELDPARLARDLQAERGALSKALPRLISGLSRQTAEELALRATGEETAYLNPEKAEAIAGRIAEFLGGVWSLAAAELALAEDGAPLDVTAFPYELYRALEKRACSTLSQAMDEYYRQRDNFDRIAQKSSALRRVLKNNIERCEKKLALQLEALEGSARMEEYRIKGELVNAAQGTLSKGQKKALLTNYYDPDCAEIEVELDEKLSPSQNAQRFFKLYQKARSAQKLAAEQKARTEEELDYFEGQLFNLEACEGEAELGEIREELEKLGYVRGNHNRRQIKSLPPSRPLHFRSSVGADILVGKNNLQNDKLTQSADPEETWLHAKNMPGSHVIIVGGRPDERTLYEAALLAAHYSKGSGSSNVPVDYTLRKYVKKPSGAKPGFVIYTHQRTLNVTPDGEARKGIVQA